MLSPKHRLFDREGFIRLAEELADSEVSELLDELSQLRKKPGQAGIRHVLKCAQVFNLAHDPRFLLMARQILGPEAFPFRATFFDKSPKSNWLIAWHQDTALPLRERREMSGWGPWSIKDGVNYAHAPASALCQVMALRVHLDDSTLFNGPLRVLSGSHTSGILSDDEIQRLSTSTTQVTCTVPKGGVLAIRPLVVHASSKSQTDASRRVLQVEYAAHSNFDGMLLAES